MSSTFVAKGADGYDQYMGRWSKRLAPLFLDFAGVADGERIIDVGCGTGSLTFLIPDRAHVAIIEAIDFEPQFIEALVQAPIRGYPHGKVTPVRYLSVKTISTVLCRCSFCILYRRLNWR